MVEKTHVVCSNCEAVNRVPTVRLGDAPNCGQCRKPLFMGKPVSAKQANFSKIVEKNDLPVVVDFWAPWCGPCKMMAPVFEQAALKLEPGVRFVKVNTEEEQLLAAQYQIRSIPTIAVFKKSKEIARQAGAMNLQGLTTWLQQVLV